MSLITRLDGRSVKNRSISIVSGDGEILAEVSITSNQVWLEIITRPDLHIEKPSGWSSIKKEEEA